MEQPGGDEHLDGEGPPSAEVLARDADARLIEAVAAGDADAFAALYDRYAPQAYGLALRVSRDRRIAEESVRDAFLTLWRRPGAYRPARGSLQAYVLQIVHNKAVDTIRHEEGIRRRALAARAQDPPEAMDDDALTEMAWQAVRRQQVRAGLRRLSRLQREALELAYFEGLSYAQVADALGIPLGTAKTRIRDGILRLRGLLSPECLLDA